MKITEIINEQNEEQTIVKRDTAEVSAAALPFLQAQVEKLNKRAKKNKLPEIKLEIVRSYMKVIPPERAGGPEHQVSYHTVKLTGDAPIIAGYKFIATIEHQLGGNIIRTVPGEENNKDIKAFYEVNPDYCDHCKKIRKRVDTFIVKEESTGKLRQIGRNCLKDFLDGTDPSGLLWWFENRDNIYDLASNAAGQAASKQQVTERFYLNEKVLALASALISKRGYISSKVAREREITATASWIKWFLNETLRLTRERQPDEVEIERILSNPSAEDSKKADTVLAWFKSLPETEREANEYMHNLNVIVTTGQVNDRNVGYLISLFPVYDRANGVEHKKQQKSNEHVGVVGQKIPPTQVTVIRTRSISGPYGNTQIATMEDAAGNMFVWFNNSQMRMEEGEQHTIVGTVKEHSDYNGRKQTVLTRVKTS